jgi:alpha-amylase
MEYDHQGLKRNQDRHRQALCNWINGTGKVAAAFDFTTKGILQEAVRNCQYWRLRDSSGKPPGLLGWWPSKAVTFIDNHDTGSTQKHWPFPSEKVLIGYAYILTHPGIPCIFWDHLIEWSAGCRQSIMELSKARRDSGMRVDAEVRILQADGDLYLAEIGNPPALRVALGPRGTERPDKSYWSDAARGTDWRVWVHRVDIVRT